MGKCYNGEIHVDTEVRMLLNKKIPLRNNPDKCGIFDIPIFHHSIIPCVRQKHKPQKATLFSMSYRNSETFNDS
jgi:hypothetical protein